MTSSLNIQLTNELRKFIDERASDIDVYSTPSEYIRDLVRRDMESRQKDHEIEVAEMLMEARKSPVSRLKGDFLSRERKLLRARSLARKRRTRA